MIMSWPSVQKEYLMQITGIIAEYNPFHNGHKYHVSQAREQTNADVIVAVMSGNFVQRGELALFDKWTRAKEALTGGVDVVFELPFSAAVQPGHIFAQQAIGLLYAAGVSKVVCGAEHPEYDFMTLARTPINNATAFKAYQQTYATTYYAELAKATGVTINEPNDVLALSYAAAIIDAGLEDKMQLLPIQRIGANYHDTKLPSDQIIASATAIRTNQVDLVNNYVPAQTAYDLAHIERIRNFTEVLWPFLQYRVQSATVQELANIYQVTEGLEYKLKQAINDASSYHTLMAILKSKRYTTARLQRMLLYVVLNVTAEQMQVALKQPYLNLLGATPQGQKWLRQLKKQATIPMYSRIGQEARLGQFALQYQVDQVFSKIAKQAEQNIGRIPWH